ncbi:Protein of unknown function [Gryllus bimaculatus]|nr:Protein of unknown function [Gryllus bimaculatus]
MQTRRAGQVPIEGNFALGIGLQFPGGCNIKDHDSNFICLETLVQGEGLIVTPFLNRRLLQGANSPALAAVGASATLPRARTQPLPQVRPTTPLAGPLSPAPEALRGRRRRHAPFALRLAGRRASTGPSTAPRRPARAPARPTCSRRPSPWPRSRPGTCPSPSRRRCPTDRSRKTSTRSGDSQQELGRPAAWQLAAARSPPRELAQKWINSPDESTDENMLSLGTQPSLLRA